MEHSIKVSYGTDVCKIIFDNLDIRAKTVGIGISDFYGTESTYEFLHTLCTQRHDLKVALIPGNQNNPNLILLPEDVLGIYLYQGAMSEVVKGYDVWVTIGSDEVTFNNNLPDTTVSGDKFVVANQMKTVVLKSLINRTDIPWWMELPEPVSDKTHLAAQLLAVINNNQPRLREIESTVKEKLRLNEFDPSLVMVFAYPPIGISATLQPGGNKRNTSLKSVRLQIGSTYFYFGVEQGINIDWVTLMIKQLECFINYPDLYDRGTV